MKKVFLWAADRAGCHTYRMRWPMEAIQSGPDAEQFDISTSTIISGYEKEHADTIVGQRVSLDAPSGLWQQFARQGNKRMVYELDDLLFNVDPENTKACNIFSRTNVLDNIRNNIRVSDTVTVSTEPLAEAIHKETGHPDIRVIPNALPPWVLDHEPEARTSVGWLGSPTHHRDFEPVSRHLRRFFENNPDATFRSIGYDYGRHIGLPKAQRRYTSWVNSPEEAFRAIDYRLGIIPLTPSVFARSKSSCKWLELAALGIPAIVSDLKPYDEVQHGVTGLKIRYDHEWSKALRTMHEDPDLRQELGAAAKEYARSRTTEQTRKLWQDAWT